MRSVSKEIIAEWREWLVANKSEQVEVFDLRDVSQVIDYAVVATAVNQKHSSHLCEAGMLWAKSQGYDLVYAEGVEHPYWSILDFGDYAVHLMLPEARQRYRIEEFWKECLRTGMVV